ncbi:hypothetical protein AB0B07_02635 [Streptomyces sioyaensis]|uniref:Uncharacterized protein n=1 Tax=Streptomyces caniferus TaxID=285557 RepID=A0ABZ1VJW8_9ACTN|nr:hypothetical protein [Streptomyces caniferus]
MSAACQGRVHRVHVAGVDDRVLVVGPGLEAGEEVVQGLGGTVSALASPTG